MIKMANAEKAALLQESGEEKGGRRRRAWKKRVSRKRVSRKRVREEENDEDGQGPHIARPGECMLSVSAFEGVDWILPFRSEEPTNGKGSGAGEDEGEFGGSSGEDGQAGHRSTVQIGHVRKTVGAGGVERRRANGRSIYMIVLIAAVALSHVTVLGIRH